MVRAHSRVFFRRPTPGWYFPAPASAFQAWLQENPDGGVYLEKGFLSRTPDTTEQGDIDYYNTISEYRMLTSDAALHKVSKDHVIYVPIGWDGSPGGVFKINALGPRTGITYLALQLMPGFEQISELANLPEDGFT